MVHVAKRKPKEDSEKMPRLARPPHPSFFEKLKERPQAEPVVNAPRLEKRSSEQVTNAFRMLARGWDGAIEKSLSVPDNMLYFEGANARFYSSCEDGRLGNLLIGLGTGRLILPNADFGIILYETSSTVYLVLFDARRRILVRESLLCYHNDPPEREWSSIRKSVESAIALARSDDAKKKGLFAVHDGTLRLVKPEEAPPMEPSLPAA
jgi:hypothetical protein